MPKLPVVDTYLHLVDLKNPDLHYAWLAPEARNPRLGERFESLKSKSLLIDDYIRETRDADVVGAVHAEVATGTKEPIKETQWVQAAADRTGFPLAIMTLVPLQDPQAERELERRSAYAAVRAVNGGFGLNAELLGDSSFQRSFGLLPKYNWGAEVFAGWQLFDKVRDLARRFPHIPMAIPHAGAPRDGGSEAFQGWQKGMKLLAEAENVSCKISGLVMSDQNWTVESLRPRVLAAIEALGPKRIMFASHWPIDPLFGTPRQLLDAYKAITAGFTLDERMDMFSRNAAKFYRLDVDKPGRRARGR